MKRCLRQASLALFLHKHGKIIDKMCVSAQSNRAFLSPKRRPRKSAPRPGSAKVSGGGAGREQTTPQRTQRTPKAERTRVPNVGKQSTRAPKPQIGESRSDMKEKMKPQMPENKARQRQRSNTKKSVEPQMLENVAREKNRNTQPKVNLG